MKFIVFILVFLFFYSLVNLATSLYPHLNPLCQSLGGKSLHSEIHWAILCGQKLSNQYYIIPLKDLGLYHLFVLSGAHFSILLDLVSKRISHFYRIPIASLMLCIWGNAMPVLRAFLFYTSESVSKLFSLSWDRNSLFLISQFFCLLYIQESWQLQSLWLSSMVSFLLIHIGAKKDRLLSKALLQSLIYFCVLSVFPATNSVSLLSIPLNLFMAGPLLLFLFLSSLFHHPLEYLGLCSPLQESLFYALNKLSLKPWAPKLSNNFELEFPIVLLAICLLIKRFKKKKSFAVIKFLIPLFLPSLLIADEFIIWNVGQGLSCSYVTQEHCFHFDLGGEYIDLNKFISLCKSKQNEIWISHFDSDHISLIPMLSRYLQVLCHHREDYKENKNSTYYLRKTPLCKPRPPLMRTLSPSIPLKRPSVYELFDGKHNSFKKENERSKVYLLDHKILLPGDSTKNAEKIWAHSKALRKVELLVLGHHGSKTSSSALLLRKLKNLKLSISSARKAKYGHPHKEVSHRLMNKKIPQLRTEDWGNIRIQFK